jgi:hypothetical protein
MVLVSQSIQPHYTSPFSEREINSGFTVGSARLLHTVSTVVSLATPHNPTGDTNMKTSHALFAIALTAATLGGTAIAAQPTANQATDTADWLAIPAIYEKVTAAGYSDISEIERESDGYEIKAYDSNGDRVKLFVDPVSGEVLDVKAKKDKADKYRDDRSSDKRDRNNERLSNNTKQ